MSEPGVSQHQSPERPAGLLLAAVVYFPIVGFEFVDCDDAGPLEVPSEGDSRLLHATTYWSREIV